MEEKLNRYQWPSLESVAIGGGGPIETLKIMSVIIAKQHLGMLS
jgi:hypothetical protein